MPLLKESCFVFWVRASFPMNPGRMQQLGLDLETCSVCGWQQHKRNGFWPHLWRERMYLNPRRFLQLCAETGNRGIFSVLLCCLLEEWDRTQSLFVVSSPDTGGGCTEKSSGPITFQMSQMRTLWCRESTGPRAGAVSSTLPRREVAKRAENRSQLRKTLPSPKPV